MNREYNPAYKKMLKEGCSVCGTVETYICSDSDDRMAVCDGCPNFEPEYFDKFEEDFDCAVCDVCGGSGC